MRCKNKTSIKKRVLSSILATALSVSVIATSGGTLVSAMDLGATWDSKPLNTFIPSGKNLLPDGYTGSWNTQYNAWENMLYANRLGGTQVMVDLAQPTPRSDPDGEMYAPGVRVSSSSAQTRICATPEYSVASVFTAPADGTYSFGSGKKVSYNDASNSTAKQTFRILINGEEKFSRVIDAANTATAITDLSAITQGTFSGNSFELKQGDKLCLAVYDDLGSVIANNKKRGINIDSEVKYIAGTGETVGTTWHAGAFGAYINAQIPSGKALIPEGGTSPWAIQYSKWQDMLWYDNMGGKQIIVSDDPTINPAPATGDASMYAPSVRVSSGGEMRIMATSKYSVAATFTAPAFGTYSFGTGGVKYYSTSGSTSKHTFKILINGVEKFSQVIDATNSATAITNLSLLSNESFNGSKFKLKTGDKVVLAVYENLGATIVNNEKRGITVYTTIKNIDPVAKQELHNQLNSAKTLFKSAVAGTLPGQYPQTAITDMGVAITAADIVFDNEEATPQEITDATGAITLAVQTFTNEIIPFTVTYDNNGGTGTAPTETDKKPGATFEVAAGTELTAPDGMEFTGWNTEADGTGTEYAVGATVTMPSSNITLYAQWSNVNYTVTYDVNGGTGTAPTETEKVLGATFEAAAGTELTAPAGKEFSGWNSAADGTGTAYAAGATVTMPASNITLYAQWSNINYTVTYDVNGGTGIAPIETDKTLGATFEAAAGTTLTAPTGKTFNGWNTAADGTGTAYAAGATVTMPANNITLYAQWAVVSQTTYTVKFNTSGGTKVADIKVVSGKTVSKPKNPTKSGYKFVGWYTSNNFSKTFNFNTKITKATTVYACFEKISAPKGLKKINAKAVKGKSIGITWKKVKGATSVKGTISYKIEWSTNKNFKKAKSATVKTNNTYTAKKLKKNTTYYFRITAIKKVGNVSVESAYTKPIKIKTAKK